MALFSALFAVLLAPTVAFTVGKPPCSVSLVAPTCTSSQGNPISFSSLSTQLAPTFDKEAAKWIPDSPQEEASAGYGPIGSLLRQGPQPYFQRLFKADDYDQAVLKFMAGEPGLSRDEAQASMDAYLRNPSDWAYDRMEEQKFGIKIDYLTLKTDKVVLTLVWSAIVFFLGGRAVYSLYFHEDFWSFLWYK